VDAEPESNLLPICPRCAYSLRGLPVEHRCPECGLAFDRRWRVFGGQLLPGPRDAGARLPIIGLAYAVFWSLVAAVLVWFAAPRGWTSWLLLTVVAAVTALMAWLVFTKPRKFVAVGPEGVVIYHGPTRTQRFPWTQLGRAEFNIARGGVIFLAAGKPLRLDRSTFFRSNYSEMDRCVQTLNSYPRPRETAASRNTPQQTPSAST